MEEQRFVNRTEGKGTPAGNFAGRRARLQQDCTVKLFPPLREAAAPPAAEDAHLMSVASLRSAGRSSRGCNCSCKCSCKKISKKSRCDSRTLGSALSRCSSRMSSLSSWSSCSSRSSASSTCSSLGGGREMSALSAVSRSMETKEALKRIAEELASDVHVPIEHLEKMNGALGDSRGDPHAPPPSRILTGAHFMDWYIPRHIAGSRALHRSGKSAAAKRSEIASPMHKPEKQAWVTQIIDPKKTSLSLPTPPKPPVLEHPCPRADNLWAAFSKDQINVNPSMYAHHLANSSYLSSSFPPPNFSSVSPPQSAQALKSLLLKNNGRSFAGQGGGVEPLSGSMFTKSQVPNKTWFIVHPDWRQEPGPGRDM